MGWLCFFFFQAEDGIRDLVRSRGLGDVYKRQVVGFGRDAADGDVRVVDQPGQVFFAIGFRHFHLFHAPKTLPLVIPAQAGIQRLGIAKIEHLPIGAQHLGALVYRCLFYTSDAADQRSSVDFGGRRFLKKTTIKSPHKIH